MKLTWSDVTPKAHWLDRRAFIATAAALSASPALALSGKPSGLSTDEKPNTLEEITNYNNYYEFGTGKEDPARNAGGLKTDPWSVEIGGLVDRPGSYGVEDLAPENTLEERIYRLRCVEGWSMVIPWIGVPLASVLNRAGIQPSAKFVAFETVTQPDNMPGLRYPILDWPYREGLRLDEAMHPLAILATGLYSDPLPNQNGAPIRLVVPWKYGFKSIKSIVRITLSDSQPYATWNASQPNEYGFYANVNPNVDHPRWSQASERRIGAGLFAGREETLMFNGYADQVASLYSGMDLKKNF
ncbi:MAG: protein-methionine-sulfoxide reductase catalytic subunit MsrP [Paracoccus sp. (in: a-proteobacteria)]|jgi:sulfoxide reductase catalytic subunit YedY|uniref:protein-methionine-sulfoxide reductase catalytic subunit MsrP n=1 Tax=unclassified Paracoccus (in: a-proteobacteria) TaxID=2688777 RepID=UPI000C5BE6F7|nr:MULTISPECIES: protein-methionine-sulfoxide reductase catalytic subunit MsrP [unclassified Paracoccus (in: a-proteobacteria)]MAN57372.1 protein-methionine-sulfoxide reductase catalytic subunit MsrP [Paracoccus sp. (in: a-proteobacteria)]MBA49998.1 protein-methionine-sulfoxide reductase catalytic subunit MsrP [Paracoccus sp. (in: a-proteobacteria)]MDB2552719.1 protein-methionine-sulfoxide reductase catalytic subunit MsrP [Paracoccus sp. (in: a-proteobacteria)]HIC66080.1 protein-methionine-sulf|tara:strand:+ start:2463 stop:3359 length:897 start_codon:yes stop_codon:yes gene_type:complete